jgi:hypothetical protein
MSRVVGADAIGLDLLDAPGASRAMARHDTVVNLATQKPGAAA